MTSGPKKPGKVVQQRRIIILDQGQTPPKGTAHTAPPPAGTATPIATRPPVTPTHLDEAQMIPREDATTTMKNLMDKLLQGDDVGNIPNTPPPPTNAAIPKSTTIDTGRIPMLSTAARVDQTTGRPKITDLFIMGQGGGLYRAVRPLTEGGMAALYEGTDLATGQKVAIKLLTPNADPTGTFNMKERFEIEAELLRRTESRFVPKFIDYSDNPLALVMEFVEGDLLSDVLNNLWDERVSTNHERATKRQSPLSGPIISEQIALGIIKMVLEALRDVARGMGNECTICHRDLKPENIMLKKRETPLGDTLAAKYESIILIDFGIAKLDAPGRTRVTLQGQRFGTPEYAPPEAILKGSDTVEPSGDIYSTMIILYELLTGRPPYDTATFVSNIPGTLAGILQNRPAEISVKVWEMMCKGLTLNPVERYQSYEAALKAVTDLEPGLY